LHLYFQGYHSLQVVHCFQRVQSHQPVPLDQNLQRLPVNQTLQLLPEAQCFLKLPVVPQILGLLSYQPVLQDLGLLQGQLIP